MRTTPRKEGRYLNREVSWLSFNHRVLQEARDLRVPLYERIRFLAIFSSNLDEYFRVRVASLRALLRTGDEAPKELDFDPALLLHDILAMVDSQQEEFGEILRLEIIPALRERGIFLVSEADLNEDQARYVSDWFAKHLADRDRPSLIDSGAAPDLRNNQSYLALLLASGRLATLEIPSPPLGRFLSLPSSGSGHFVISLDDVLRHCLADLFPDDRPVACHAVKLTRDASLRIEDEFGGDLLEAIGRSLAQRARGIPSRFLYDAAMPGPMLERLTSALGLSHDDLVPGARYHGMSDLLELPLPDRPELGYANLPPLAHPALNAGQGTFETISRGDVLLHFPYHAFDPVLDFIREAARDPAVEALQISLYRTAADSRVVRTLIEAARVGKSVTAFIEVSARFDEEINIRWAEELEKAGARVFYRHPFGKVHAKLCLVTRREGATARGYAYLSTGNFNEGTVRVYSDAGHFTADRRIVADVGRVFDLLVDPGAAERFECVLVAPLTMREALCGFVDTEIRNAQRGRVSGITLKLNNLQDPDMIEKLYEASTAGVRVRLIVRGICCLVPGIQRLSENIEVISVVDRFLEHMRVYLFHNGGDEHLYLSSADWMTRNLSQRVEVAWPIFDPTIRAQLREILELQWRDRVKARVIDADQTNAYRASDLPDSPGPQSATYELLRA